MDCIKTNFHKKKIMSDGLDQRCRKCWKQYYLDNRDRKKQYYLNIQDRIKEYFLQNRDRIKEYQLKNHDRILAGKRFILIIIINQIIIFGYFVKQEVEVGKL